MWGKLRRSFLPVRRQRQSVDLLIEYFSSNFFQGSALVAQRSKSVKDIPILRSRPKGKQEKVLRQLKHKKRGIKILLNEEKGAARR